MKISYVTIYDGVEVHNWSGLSYFLSKALKDQQAELDFIGNLKSNPPLSMVAKKVFHRLTGKRFFFEREPLIARQYASQVMAAIKQDSDVIFAPGTIPIAFVESSRPKVFYGDACFAGMLGFYDSFSHMCRETIAHGHYIEQQALDTAAMAIYSSEWAARTAIEHYKIDPARVKVVPFGANIESNRTGLSIKELVSRRSRTRCNLLFMGVDWERKGGDLAVAVAKKLNESGLPTTLHLAGIEKAPVHPLPDYVVNHGFISKSTPAGREKIDELFFNAHFLILPTKAECYGLVFCEASSFGLPSLATNVGGIPTAVEDDINGRLFPLTSGADDYASYILTLFHDWKRYEQLCFSSFDTYENKLNWKTSGKAVVRLLKEL